VKMLGIFLIALAFTPLQAHAEDGRKPTVSIGMVAGNIFRDCTDCPDMVVVPAGGFDMNPNTEQDEEPAHRVTISYAFAMGKYEVTQAEWRTVMQASPSHFSNCGDTCPVEKVSWDNVQEFIQKLNAKTGKQYRLPTRAEWEYACYGGSQSEYCGGNDLNAVAWTMNNSNGQTHPVGQKQANGYGLYDMTGNVWEWMDDCWQRECARRALRGGSWINFPQLARTVPRGRYVTSSQHDDADFAWPGRCRERGCREGWL